jgi:LysR family transcriptional regulator, chromosome initiation inhibitor
MTFDPKQLDAFASALETGSLSKAAAALRITLAATSLRIKALEGALGQRLLVRGKTVRATAAGQALLAHIKQVRLLEADLAHSLAPARSGTGRARQFQILSVAVNADSFASWFLPGVQSALQRHRLLVDVVVDDQDHTLQWLKNGDVVGCITTLAQPLRGCVAQVLGTMRYHCLAAPALAQQLCNHQQPPSAHALLASPAVSFNRKDRLQDQFLEQHLGLREPGYPRHYVPAGDAYHWALLHGLGWGMGAALQYPGDLAAGRLLDLFPGRHIDVPLYWHHWAREAPQAARLSQAIQSAAEQSLQAAAASPHS